MKDDDLLHELDNIASWMDAKFSIPGTNIRFGLDPLVGLIPLLGDLFDVKWKANIRNVELLRRHLSK